MSARRGELALEEAKAADQDASRHGDESRHHSAVTARAEEVPDAGEELRIEGTAIGSPEVLTEGAGARLADIAKALRADVDEITRLCAHLAAALPAPVVRHVALAKQ